MKNTKIKKIIYFAVAVLVLVVSILPIFLSESASLNEDSGVLFVFAICSVIYAVIAVVLKDKGNLFVVGRHRMWRALSWSFSDKRIGYTASDEYKKEIERSAFAWCVTIPAYITFAFFADGFYSALSAALGWSIFRLVAVMIVGIVPTIIKRANDRKQQRLREEAERKEQERRESMGEWK